MIVHVFEIKDVAGFEGTGADPSSATDAELSGWLADLDRVDAAVASAKARVLAEWDARMVWAADGGLSGATWLANRHDVSRAGAARELRIARRLRDMPVVSAALASGEMGAAKARVFADARHDDLTEEFTRDEAMLVSMCEPLTVDQTAQVLRHWANCARPDGGDGDAADARDESCLFVSRSINGTHFLKGQLDAEWGAELVRALDAKMRDIYEAERQVDDHKEGAPARKASNRRAQALMELIAAGTAAAVTDDGTPRALPSLIAIVDADVLANPPGTPAPFGSTCEIEGAGPVPAETLRRLACESILTVAAMKPDGAVLNMGRSIRTANRAQRRTLLLRDRGCMFPGCDRPAYWCHAHHIKWWETGGTTDLDNLVLLCTRHHHMVHEGGYRLTRAPDGRLDFRRPDGTQIEHGRPNHLPLRIGPPPAAPTRSTQPQLEAAS